MYNNRNYRISLSCIKSRFELQIILNHATLLSAAFSASKKERSTRQEAISLFSYYHSLVKLSQYSSSHAGFPVSLHHKAIFFHLCIDLAVRNVDRSLTRFILFQCFSKFFDCRTFLAISSTLIYSHYVVLTTVIQPCLVSTQARVIFSCSFYQYTYSCLRHYTNQ